jgi:hypothetical protein
MVKELKIVRPVESATSAASGFIPVFAGAGESTQWILQGADKEVDPQRKQNNDADGR